MGEGQERKRRSNLIETRHQYPSKPTVWDAVEQPPQTTPTTSTPKTVREVIIRYEIKRMARCHSKV